MKKENIAILKMLEEGKISVEETMKRINISDEYRNYMNLRSQYMI